MTDNLGKDHASFGAELLQWAIFRGNPARNAASAGGMPLLDRRWGVWTTENPSAVITSRQANIDRNIPIMPVSQPLAVADVVLMRTTNGLLAVDFVTGKRIWAADNLQGRDEAQHGGPRNVMQQQADASLGERLWENATLGTLASDGQYVFMVEDPKSDGFSTDQQRVVVRQFGVWRGPIDQATNQLAAYELRTQGKVVWKVGGSDKRDFDIEPKLAGVYFLGAPLPLDGLLYVLAERPKDQAVYLVVLDAKTGKLQWQQQLVATTDSNMNGFQENYRRLTGATPSFADGVLVCPTSAGAIVAVDLATHKLLWGYEYPQAQVGQGPNMMAMRFAMGNGGFPVPSYAGDRWADATATIVDGRVLVTPVEVGGEQPMYCLSLIDGKLLWKIDQRGDNVYIGAVYDGKVVVVGKRKVEAYSLVDTLPGPTKEVAPTPKQLWSLDLDTPAEGSVAEAAKPAAAKPDVAKSDAAAATPRGAMPAGRGFLSGGCYYLPLSTAEVARIDIARGKIVSRARSRKGLIPGNLICYKDDVISLGVDSLDAFHQIEPLKARVAAALAKNPDDPEALADRGRIELDEGKLTDSIQNIRRAYDHETREVAAINQEFSNGRISEEEAQKRRKRPESGLAVTRGLLVDAMLAALRSDFKGSRVSIGDLEKLITLDSERAEFLRMLADGLQKSGDRLAAVDAYLKLADLQWGQGEPESVEPNLSVRRDRWVEARMDAIYASANPTDRSKIDAELSARLKTVLAGKNDKELRAYANYFSFHPTADDARAALVRQLTGSESMIERQSLLCELERSGDPVHRRMATAQMAALLRSASRPEEAAIYYSPPENRFRRSGLPRRQDGQADRGRIAGEFARDPRIGRIDDLAERGRQGEQQPQRRRNEFPTPNSDCLARRSRSVLRIDDDPLRPAAADRRPRRIGPGKIPHSLERSRAESIRLSADQRDHRIRQRQGESVVRQSRHPNAGPRHIAADQRRQPGLVATRVVRTGAECVQRRRANADDPFPLGPAKANPAIWRGRGAGRRRADHRSLRLHRPGSRSAGLGPAHWSDALDLARAAARRRSVRRQRRGDYRPARRLKRRRAANDRWPTIGPLQCALHAITAAAITVAACSLGARPTPATARSKSCWPIRGKDRMRCWANSRPSA